VKHQMAAPVSTAINRRTRVAQIAAIARAVRTKSGPMSCVLKPGWASVNSLVGSGLII
jgi:hypothetical protein